jgi:hypothetical protein
MERPTGWKSLPVILKIIWILLLLGAAFSILGVFTASKEGFMVMGRNMYGLWAANTMFAVNILAPVILLVAMIKRYFWTWIWGVILYVFIIVNEFFMFGNIRDTVEKVISQLPEQYFEMVPDIYSIGYYSVILGMVFGIMTDLFFLIVFIVKRKYFARSAEQVQ